jgi:hypothetical protein
MMMMMAMPMPMAAMAMAVPMVNGKRETFVHKSNPQIMANIFKI